MKCLALLQALLLVLAVTAVGAESPPPVKFILHPASQPTPALKYRLLPEWLDQVAGNAAVHYGKVTAEETAFFSRKEIRERVMRWQQTPLQELRGHSDQLNSQGGIEASLRRAARCCSCDWQLPIGEEPFFTILLPEMQQTRYFAAILAARARFQIADGQFADAIETIQTGYAMGQHVAKSECLVSILCGHRNIDIMSQQVLDFVQQPESPNLYWALTMLPNPFVDAHDALDVEASGVELTYAELRDIATAQRTLEEWRVLFHRIAKQLHNDLSIGESTPLPSPEALDERCQQGLPVAKQRLMASGIPMAQLESMPIHQVSLLHLIIYHRELYSDGIKSFFLPYPVAIAGLDASIVRATRQQPEIFPVATNLLTSARGVRQAMARTDRQIAALRVIEALRLYGASHQGQLPQRLEQIEEVLVPDDPVTDRPFTYLRHDNMATLQSPAVGNDPLHYEITMESPGHDVRSVSNESK